MSISVLFYEQIEIRNFYYMLSFTDISFRWVTDAIFCPDTLMFIMTNTARSIIIYEASGLNHVPYWLILSTPNILEVRYFDTY